MNKEIKISIKNRWTGSILFEYSSVDNTLAKTVTEALKGNANLRGADLCGANLRGATLCGATLCGADLRDADLCGATLCDADLCGANLRGATLCGADLCGADLRDADLCGADLRDADLCGATLCGADLRGADLRVRRQRYIHGLPHRWQFYRLEEGFGIYREAANPGRCPPQLCWRRKMSLRQSLCGGDSEC